MGTALDVPGGHSTMPPRKNGGNMDVKQLVAGTTLYLPVWVDGALFSVGDAHAAQGDGEVCVTAVEMKARVTLRFGLQPGRHLREPQLRTRGPLAAGTNRGPYFATTAHGPDLFAAAQQAVRYMIDHLVAERGALARGGLHPLERRGGPQDQRDRGHAQLDHLRVPPRVHLHAADPMMLDRLDHLVLTVRDPAATCDFYRRVLGMEMVTFGQGRLALRFGSQKINLHGTGQEFEPKAERPTPGSGDLCFLTDEPLQTWVGRLAENSVPLLEGPVKRTGALGPIESIYLRDPDGNLLEIARRLETDGDGFAQVREWLGTLQACVRARDFDGGRRLCDPDTIAFGTVADFVEGVDRVMERQWTRVWPNIRDFTIRIDEARGAVQGDQAWVAAPWDSRGVRSDGTTFPRPGRLTVVLARRQGRWLAVHTHFSLTPSSTQL